MLNSKDLQFKWKPEANGREVRYVISNEIDIVDSMPDICLDLNVNPKKKNPKRGIQRMQSQSFNSLFPCAYNLQNYDNSTWVKKATPIIDCPFKILLVDDQSFNLDALMVILKYSVGMDSKKYCDKALSGEQALNMVEENPNLYNLILMDCNMPEMDGIETTKRIRSFLM